ncbi:unnamed protein product [Calypogeia fissa]
MESSDPASLEAAASKALNLAAEYSYGSMNDDGHWRGEVLDNTTTVAQYVFLNLALGHDFGTDPANGSCPTRTQMVLGVLLPTILAMFQRRLRHTSL